MAKEKAVKTEKEKETKRKKTSISMYPWVIYRLDMLAAHLSLKRGVSMDRSDLVEELVLPHLKSIVIQERGDLPIPEKPAE
jgi:hypothetical protein